MELPMGLQRAAVSEEVWTELGAHGASGSFTDGLAAYYAAASLADEARGSAASEKAGPLHTSASEPSCAISAGGASNGCGALKSAHQASGSVRLALSATAPRGRLPPAAPPVAVLSDPLVHIDARFMARQRACGSEGMRSASSGALLSSRPATAHSERTTGASATRTHSRGRGKMSEADGRARGEDDVERLSSAASGGDGDSKIFRRSSITSFTFQPRELKRYELPRGRREDVGAHASCSSSSRRSSLQHVGDAAGGVFTCFARL